MSRKLLFIFIILMLVFSSCASRKNLQYHLETSNCGHIITQYETMDDIASPIHEVQLDSSLFSNFSPESLNIANAINILNELSQYQQTLLHSNTKKTVEERVFLSELSQRITHRINLASLEISAVASELDCEEERITQIADYVKGKEAEKESKLTAMAIVVGATGAVASGIMLANKTESNLPEYVGIGTGISEAVLGLLILVNNKKVEVYHSRNVLKDVWEGNHTSAFPSFVWYYLNYRDPEKKLSFRDQLIENWENFYQIQGVNEKRSANC